MREVVNRQHLKTDLLVLEIDGSAVTTTSSQTGLTYGQFCAKVKKGEGSDSNLVTITLNNPLGLAPKVFFNARTLDCECRLEEEPTKTVIKVRTLLNSNLASKADDADFQVLIVGTRETRQGNYG